MKIVYYAGHARQMAELMQACESGGVIVCTPNHSRFGVLTDMRDANGSLQIVRESMMPRSAQYHAHFLSEEEALEYLIKMHCDTVRLRSVCEREDVWSHVYVCEEHPPCEMCASCLTFMSLLSEYSVEHVYDLVCGKNGTYYAFDSRITE